MSIEQMIPQMQTGDLLLFSNNDFPLMKMVFKNEWTHVALVMRDPTTGFLYLYESIPGKVNNVNMQDEITHEIAKDGPQMLPLLDRVQKYKGYVAWRPLYGLSKSERDTLWYRLIPFFHGMSDQGFEKAATSIPLWLKLASHFQGNDQTSWFHSEKHLKNRTGVFCSELVAAALSYVGILSTVQPQNHCSTFAPGAFAPPTKLPYHPQTKAHYDNHVYEISKSKNY